MNWEVVPGGTVTTPRGFLAGAVMAGIKSHGGLDLALLYSEVPCLAAGVFTTNKIKAASVLLTRRLLRQGRAQAIVVNSGCANTATGKRGRQDAQTMTSLAAQRLGLSPNQVLVASTGIIGTFLPLEKIKKGISQITLSKEGGHQLAKAIMTTDTQPKEIAVKVDGNGFSFFIGGVAKGAGMIHPQLATLLAFITTDAAIERGFLKRSLRQAVANSFNMITVDGDTSPNDMVLILANGLAGNKPLREGVPGAELFQKALAQVCLFLARSIVRYGEGASKLIEVRIEGASNSQDAWRAARAIASSNLVKTAVYGANPNWGRILAALGRSGAKLDEGKIDLYLDKLCVMKDGSPLEFPVEQARAILSRKEVLITIRLNLGSASATAWGCDLTPEYVSINSAYTT